MFHSQLKIHLPQRVCPSPAALGSGVLTLLYGVEEGFRDIAKDMLSQDRLEEKTPPYLMMLFQRSRALMMIIIIINGTARELTNNGEQMIPSWPKKKKSVRLQKIKQILSWQFKTQMPQPESVSGFSFSPWRAKSTKIQLFPTPALPHETK